MRHKSWAERVPSQPCVTQNGMETGTREGPQPIVLLKRDTNLKAYVVVWLKSYTFVCLFGECQFRETREHQPWVWFQHKEVGIRRLAPGRGDTSREASRTALHTKLRNSQKADKTTSLRPYHIPCLVFLTSSLLSSFFPVSPALQVWKGFLFPADMSSWSATRKFHYFLYFWLITEVSALFRKKKLKKCKVKALAVTQWRSLGHLGKWPRD